MALMLLLASCGEEKDVRTAIPRDARAVLAVDWASMAEKGGLADPSVSQPLTEWMSRTLSADDKEYVEDLMKRAEDALAENLAELRKTRQNIKASQRTSRNG